MAQNTKGGVQATPDGQRRVTIIVRDHGRWRQAPTDDEHRRRGIPLMRAYMDTVIIGQPDDGRVGTWVVLRSRPVPPPTLGTPDNQGDDHRTKPPDFRPGYTRHGRP